MEDYIENAYGKCYLSEDRIKEMMNIANKHLRNMMLELKEHEIIPGHVSLDRTTYRELEFYKNLETSSILQ